MIKHILTIIIICMGFNSYAQTDTTKMLSVYDTTIVTMDTLHLGIPTPQDSLAKSVLPEKKSKTINGLASFYSKNLDGTKTATGEVFKNSKFTGASNHVKLNSWVRVTNLSNGNTVIVRINDRMHPKMAKKGRVIDLSRAAAGELDFIKKGLTKVKIEIVTAQTVD